MGYPVKQSTTAQPLVFFMTDSADHITGKTGLSPTVTLSKNGGSFASPSGAVSEIGSGWYKVAGNATDSGTLGPLALHATSSGADPTDDMFMVVSYDPQTSYSTLDAAGVRTAVGMASANLDTQLGAIDDYIDTEVAAIKAKTDNLPSDPADASDIAASFATVNATLATLAGYVDTEVAAIKAKTDQLTFTVSNQIDANAVSISGDSTAADNLESYCDGSEFMPVDSFRPVFSVSGATLTVKKPDGTTTAHTKTLATSPTADPVIGTS